ncbi:MAG TPA: hypothetical protein VFE33_33765 [Thermoanaerobaculia bacterium]|nr:hypothetical protein [Thermoanaerobaculia bacterium]
MSRRSLLLPLLLVVAAFSAAATGQEPSAPSPQPPSPIVPAPVAPTAPAPPAATPAPAAPEAVPPTPPKAVTAAPRPASCLCVQDGGTLEHGLTVAQEIFAGEVVGEHLVGLELRRYTILVSASWRSDLATVSAETAAGPCGAKLELGKSYLLYGTWKADHSAILIGACIRTVALEDAAEDLARLGKAPHERPITPERRLAEAEGAEQAKKALGCAAHIQDTPSYFLPQTRTIKLERQRIVDETGAERGGFRGTWTPRKGSEGAFVELLVDNHSACALHLRLDARAGGQPAHLSRSEEFIPAGPPFRVRFVVMPPAAWNGDVELKLNWDLVAGGG